MSGAAEPDDGSGGDLRTTPRSTLRRRRDRGVQRREVVEAILDEGLLCHVGFESDDGPVVQPMAYARCGRRLYLHGAPANRALGTLADGAPACVTVTLLDGIVLARSAFHHSLNYRSVMLFGVGRRIEEPDEQRTASAALLDHMAPGRSADARPPDESELRSTLFIGFPVDEGSAKIRTGGPVEEPEDLALAVWAGQIPIEPVSGRPVPDHPHPPGTAVPSYVQRYPPRRRAVS